MIYILYGTRPEWLKLKPIIHQFETNGINHRVFYVEQHEKKMFNNVNKYHGVIPIEQPTTAVDNRLNNIISSILQSASIKGASVKNLDAFMVQGDTATAFAGTLTAFNHQIPVIHVEAGLRTYDLSSPYPEEGYRQMISKLAHIHFCPTVEALQNLHNENIFDNCFVVGNTALDNLSGYQTSYNKEIICTFHRRESNIKEYFTELNKVAKMLKVNGFTVTLPIHASPSVKVYKNILTEVNVIDPLEHSQFAQKLAECAFVITDSGGIQEEASFFGKNILVCREHTERQEILGKFSKLVSPEELQHEVIQLIVADKYKEKIKYKCPYGDGTSSTKISCILKSLGY